MAKERFQSQFKIVIFKHCLSVLELEHVPARNSLGATLDGYIFVVLAVCLAPLVRPRTVHYIHLRSNARRLVDPDWSVAAAISGRMMVSDSASVTSHTTENVTKLGREAVIAHRSPFSVMLKIFIAIYQILLLVSNSVLDIFTLKLFIPFLY